MGADPKPDDHFAGLQTQGPPTDANTDRVDRATFSHQLELQTGMTGVLLPEAVVLARETLNTTWKPPEAGLEVFGEMGSQRSSKPDSVVLPSR